MNRDRLNKMKAISHLLPDPGGEIVRECIAEIERLEDIRRLQYDRIERQHDNLCSLRGEKVELMEALKKAVAYGHDVYCNAWKGPRGEEWFVEEECDCWIKEARTVLAKNGGE